MLTNMPGPMQMMFLPLFVLPSSGPRNFDSLVLRQNLLFRNLLTYVASISIYLFGFTPNNFIFWNYLLVVSIVSGLIPLTQSILSIYKLKQSGRLLANKV